MSLAVETLPVIQDPFSLALYVAFPTGVMLPLDAVTGYIADTYEQATDEELIGVARLLASISEQSEAFLADADR